MQEARFNLREANANPIYHTLQPGMRVDFRLKWQGPPSILSDLRGRLELRGTGNPEPLIAQGLGWMHRTRELSNGDELSTYVPFLLSFGVLEQIEERRKNNRLSLGLTIQALGATDPLKTGDRHSLPIRAEESTSLTIEKSTWIESFLPAYGYGDAQFIQFNFPQLHTPNTLEREFELLMEARDDYNAGDYADCFADLRKLHERLKTRYKELTLDSVVDQELFARAETMLSVALHENSGLHVHVNRGDAEMALTMTAAVYRRIADAVTRIKESP